MRPGYTEFSYGYAFTENLIRSSAEGPASAPVFPNLVQEATLGYDVKIELPAQPLFFQFKLPELMVRATAAEVSKYELPGLAPPFFRMPLMKRHVSQQHAYLIDLEAEYPGAVFYAVPELGDLSSFNNAYTETKMHEASVFFSPAEIGALPDNKSHSIAYSPSLAEAWFCSNPKPIKRRSISEIRDAVAAKLGSPNSTKLRDLVPEIERSIIAAIKRRRTRDRREGFSVPTAPEDYDVLLETVEDDGEPIDSQEGAQVERLVSVVRDRVRTRLSAPTESAPVDPTIAIATEEIAVSRELARIGLGVEVLIAQPALAEEGSS